MSDPRVRVVVDPRRVAVTVNLKAPTVTITNNTTGSVATVQAHSVATVGASKPNVNVFLGGVSNYNNAQILDLLGSSLTRAQLGAALVTELDGTISTLNVHATDLLTLGDNYDSHEVQFGIVDNTLISLNSDIEIVEGNIAVAETAIIQNSNNISLHAGRLTTNEGDIASAQASIIINADQIALSVSDILSHAGLISSN